MNNSNSRCVIIPTYRNHFPYIETFIESWVHFVQDAFIPVYFIVSDKSELEELNFLISKTELKEFKNLNIEEILAHYGIKHSSDELLKVLGRFSYQTIKKMYALYYIDFKQALILDSESICVSRINMDNFFDNYFSSPYVFYSNMPADEEYKNWVDYKTSKNVAKLLNCNFRKKWYLEGFHWFYEKSIINDLFEFFHGKLFEAIYNYCNAIIDDSEKAIFECVLYYTFVESNNHRYKYNFIDTKAELAKTLGTGLYKKIINRMKAAHLEFLPFTIHSFEYARCYELCGWKRFYKKKSDWNCTGRL